MLSLLTRWDADAIAGWVREAPELADDTKARVILLGPEIDAAGASEIVPSWGADTPPGSWIEIQLRARFGDRWSRLRRIAAWDCALTESRRTSFDAQADADGKVATDTLLLASPPDAIQVRVLLCAEPGADMPELESLACLLSTDTPHGEALADWQLCSTGAQIGLPRLYSQYAYAEGAGWCSPTAMAMLLAYWHERNGDTRLAPFQESTCVPALVVPMVYDPAWGGTGNWPFNSAYAASLGLVAYVTRLDSLAQLARWTASGVPVIVSIAWSAGELAGAPGSTAGHLTLVTGFASEYVLVAEPASREADAVLRRYPADQFYACWQRASAGIVYVVHPPAWPRPAPGQDDAWA